jgi:tetratricopeptide (TPR) repeat protein
MKIKVLYTCLMMICCSLCLVSATGDNEEHLPHYYVEQAKQDFNKNQLDAAKKILDEGLKTYPNDPDMRWLMGRYYYARHDYDKSRYNLIKSIESDYNHVEAKQLLVNVEEETKHYSSAICYVNELLEVNPYWRGLWRRKIELYRKQGNDIEADRLLHRINQIYPNDSIIQRDLNYAMEMNYIKQKKQGNLKEATAALEDLVKKNPKNEQYYLDLTNLYLQQGYTEKALETATMGAEELQGSIELVKKKVGILSDQCRYPEAMAYLRQRMKRNNSPAFAALYNGLMEDAAAAARDNDPYVLYGKIYEKGKSSEALDYLLSTSLSRGYDEDALFYLQEARKRYGNRKDILYKQYSLYKRMGYEREANNLLKRLFAIEPNNYDIANAMCQYELREAERLMANGDWSGALPYAQFVAYHEKQDEETLISAREKIVTCYTQMRRYNEALAALDTLHQKMPAYASYIDKKCYLFDKMGKTQEALDMYYDAFLNSTDGNKVMYASAYEEMAIPYIKKLNEEGAAQKAFDASKRLLSVNPKSDLGLHYAINTADKLGNYDAFEHYTSDGLAYYPNDLFYKIKQSTVYDRKKTFDKSVKLLRPEFEDYPDSPELIGAFSQSSEYYALALLKTNSH